MRQNPLIAKTNKHLLFYLYLRLSVHKPTRKYDFLGFHIRQTSKTSQVYFFLLLLITPVRFSINFFSMEFLVDQRKYGGQQIIKSIKIINICLYLTLIHNIFYYRLHPSFIVELSSLKIRLKPILDICKATLKIIVQIQKYFTVNKHYFFILYGNKNLPGSKTFHSSFNIIFFEDYIFI